MNKMTKIIIAFILMSVTVTTGVCADTGNSPAMNSTSSRIYLNGEVIAAEISKATGCAISPILGISVLGAYTYYTTPIEKRSEVPWHAKPAFWGPLFAVLMGIILKDSSKIILPKIIIMPLDAIETLLEKNASAVLGLLVILSTITGKGIEHLQVTGFGPGFSLTTSAWAMDNVPAAAMSSSGAFEIAFLSVLVTLVFGIVWVVSQSFNFLIFLCPFSWLDLLLALCKNAIIGLLLGAYLIHPFVGLFVSCLIILISTYLFVRSYRFVIFGTIVSADILFKRSRKQQVESDRIKAFAGSTLKDVPVLSYGSLSREDSRLLFQYRPWPFMPLKKVHPGYGCGECEVGIGTLSPLIVCTGRKFNANMVLFRLRPLYDSHEKKVAELLGLNGIRDMSIGKTVRDGYRWMKEQLGIGKKITPSEP